MKLNRIFVLCFIIVMLFPFQVFADLKEEQMKIINKKVEESGFDSLSDVEKTAYESAHGIQTSSIIDKMKGVNEGSASGGISNVLNIVIRLIQISGTGISIIVVTLTGIKYMLASTGEKADLKKQAVPIVIGCVVLFGAVNLVKIVADVGNGLNGPTTTTETTPTQQ